MKNKLSFSFIKVNFSIFKQARFLIFFVLACIVALFIPVFNNLFTNWDDNLYILQNPYLKSLSLNNLRQISTAYLVGNYHPLTLLSLAIDYKIGGLQPWAFQLTNLILHLFNTLLVFVFVKTLLQKISSSVNYSVIALITAGLFGIHTLQVESVAWMSERKNVLYAFFFLAALIMYLKYIDNKSRRAYIMSLVLFLLSLLSKGMAMPLSICIIAIDVVVGREVFSKKVLLEKIPFITLSLLFGFIAILAQHSTESMIAAHSYTWFDRIAIASYGFVQYLIKLCYPYNLSAFYPYPPKTGQFLPYPFYVCLGLVIVFLFVIWRFFRRNSVIIFGVLFFIINISIVIQLLPVGSAIMADRYVYIPSIGFFIIIGYCSTLLMQKNVIIRNVIIAFLIVYSSLISYKTYHRIGVWKDSVTLWNDAINKYPGNNDFGYLNRGTAYYDMGNYSMALRDYEKLLQIDPKNSAAYIGMGMIKQALKDTIGAMSDYNTALSFSQRYEGYLNRAVLKMESKDFEGALDDLDQASRFGIFKTEIYLNKGYIFFQTGNYTEALQNYNQALEADPDDSKAYRGRGQVNQATGDLQGALNDFNTAILLSPTYDYYLQRASLKFSLNDFDGALFDLDNASQTNPEGYEAYYNKGFLSMKMGNMNNAIKDFNSAIDINPNDFETYLNRGIAKFNLDQYKESVVDLSQSIRLKPVADAYYYRGVANLRLEQKSEGCSDLERSIKLGNTEAQSEFQKNCR